MSASCAERPCLRDKFRVNIIFTQRHISTVFTIEYQRKLFLIPNSQYHKRCQPFRVRDDPSDINPLMAKLLSDKPPHMLITNTGNDGRFQTQPGCPCRNIGGGAANIFLKTGHIFKATANLRPIKID